MIIAVDFDGTIVEHRYPQIGRERPFAVATLRQMQQDDPDLKLILWTVREGELLQQAVDWCAQRGLTFYAVNSNYPEELPSPTAADQACRKVVADIYIDDRNLGTLPPWPDIYRRLSTPGANPTSPTSEAPSKSSLLSRLFSRK